MATNTRINEYFLHKVNIPSNPSSTQNVCSHLKILYANKSLLSTAFSNLRLLSIYFHAIIETRYIYIRESETFDKVI